MRAITYLMAFTMPSAIFWYGYRCTQTGMTSWDLVLLCSSSALCGAVYSAMFGGDL